MTETVLRNARLVLATQILRGHLVLRDGLIAEIGTGPARRGEDLNGDLLLPGLVELHTDHIEGHYMPRPRVYWDKIAAIQAHDAQIASSGITTVFDALRVGTFEEDPLSRADMLDMGRAIEQAQDEARLRAAHFLHLRCEVSTPDAQDGFEAFAALPLLRLVSLMDHAPGQRQFIDEDAYRAYYQKSLNLSDAEFTAYRTRRQDQSARYADAARAAIAAGCRAQAIALASHDDATEAHVAHAARLGIVLAEFPTTRIAAMASRAAGMHVLMGAPNVVRGGSHSGNVAALDLLDAGALDILSSDYVPFSLLQAVLGLAARPGGSLPAAVALVTRNPARATGLTDRGEIAAGLRADLVRVRPMGCAAPVVRAVWREGARVA